MDCELREIDSGNGMSVCFCPLCERQIRVKTGCLPKRTCTATLTPEQLDAKRERELGDMAATILERSGVTASYKLALAWVKRIPVADVVCSGCMDRQKWLNNKSRQFRNWLQAVRNR